mgnify:CR=1 FL=1
MKRLIKKLIPKKILKKITLFNEFTNRWKIVADPENLGKAKNNYERFREIISDPLNLLIHRMPNAGYVNAKQEVILHNGNLVSIDINSSYYENFADILVINRGVHEPLEEFCFQELLSLYKTEEKKLIMLELGAYWGHYSMWFKKKFPKANCILVEPDKKNFETGKKNFKLNGLEAEFINEFVSSQHFTVDNFINIHSIKDIFLLHSDIQGYELEMLQNSKIALQKEIINYLMISTHSNNLHLECINEINKYNYDIDINSEPDFHSTSYDGFILARKKKL